jgi:glycosyltransferase involved in cell wall biosynthesis
MPPSISVCIATMNRWHYLKESLPKYIDNPHINEIVICDENGFDALQIKHHYGNCGKVKVYINDKKLGAGANKIRAVSLASNDWVALLDSDNFADVDYFTTWQAYIRAHGLDASTVYTPSVCHLKESCANFDFTKYSDQYVSKGNFQDSYRDPLWEMVLNNGNFIVNKHKYLHADPDHPSIRELLGRNSPLEAYLKAGALVAYGMKIHVIPDMKWYHGINKESVFCQNVDIVEEDRRKVWGYFATIT